MVVPEPAVSRMSVEESLRDRSIFNPGDHMRSMSSVDGHRARRNIRAVNWRTSGPRIHVVFGGCVRPALTPTFHCSGPVIQGRAARCWRPRGASSQRAVIESRECWKAIRGVVTP